MTVDPDGVCCGETFETWAACERHNHDVFGRAVPAGEPGGARFELVMPSDDPPGPGERWQR